MAVRTSGAHIQAMIGRLALTLLIALALGAPARARAQRITGVVVDSTGRIVADADVLVGNGTLRDRSDSTGRFSIARVPVGDQRLKVRRIGYRPFELNVRVFEDSVHTVRLVLKRMPQILGSVRVVDVNTCATNTLAGFECRRRGGVGVFRDAGELRAMRPTAWADMLDGIPTLRRVPMSTPDGLDWRVGAPPSDCVVQIYNGEDPEFNGHVLRVPADHLVPQDVVAIEYYRYYEDIPKALQRIAWPKVNMDSIQVPAISPCSMLVYWLRIAEKPRRR